ncbi:ABC transporter substrate-binding protein [Nocardiopsis ansamitocini]|uniref:ABC transporter substrate-binding protein n=1 Tax=Nocardiopsis ansamitocini TaxID=1670832 RepID=A0A9W6PAG1_9ACTN|nr:ABC transporter substrate-binding protein [Nocardiopsis ansamitocini]GLU49943.1 ABC transporter substrate-binding protein [Nocardiopsis ansamitocini]
MNRGTRPRGPVLLAGLLSLTLMSACGSPAETDGDSAGGDAASGFPVTVDTRFGEVEIPDKPSTVVALGWSDAETALALGVQPVGVSDWQAYGGKGVGPWAADLLDEQPEMLGTMDVSPEAVANLGPDVILNTRSDHEEKKFEVMSEIAPVVGPPADVEVTYGTTWRQQMNQVSQALGEKERGDEIIAALEEKFAQVVADNPDFAGSTVVVGSYFDGKYGASVPGDSRADFMEELGFEYKQEVADLADGVFYVELSGEQVEMLDADLTVMFPIGEDADTLKEDPILQALPAAEDGRLVIMDDPDLINAFSSGSTLGTEYLLDNSVSLFADALKK